MSDSLDPMDHSSPGPSVHGILLARILEWAAMPSLRGSSRPRDQTHASQVSCFGRRDLYQWHHLGSLHSTGNIFNLLPQAIVEKNLKKRVYVCMHACVYLYISMHVLSESLCYTPNTQHCKSHIFQLKKKMTPQKKALFSSAFYPSS